MAGTLSYEQVSKLVKELSLGRLVYLDYRIPRM